MKHPSISFEKAIEIALEQHRAGHFERAEALYLEILKQDPGNVDAIHLLGVLAHQGRKPEIAVDLIGAAIRKKPDAPIFHYNLAEALHALGRHDEALTAYQRAIELAPDYFEAQNNLANLLNELRRFPEAEEACRRAIALNPVAVAPINNLGNALRGLGRREEAAAAYRSAIEMRPDFAEAISNLAMCLCSMGQFDEGIEQFRRAIQLSPAITDLHNNLGVALESQGRHADAASSFRTAIDLQPDHAEAHNNLGSALRSSGRPEQSVVFFEKALELKPTFVEARANLAAALADVGRKEDALREIDAVLLVRKDSARDHFTRGILLRDLLRFDEAIDSIRKSLELDPDNVPAITALGYALQERGDVDEAMNALKRSIELNPDPQTHSNVLMTINYHPGYSQEDLLQAHRGWSELHERPHIAQWPVHTNNPSPNRKLRIGYVSPDLRGHSVSYFLEPILENHDHDAFEIYGYAHLISPDMNTWRLRASIDQWRETIGMSADQIAEKIREDEIDILVELAGHTANNSLPVFARKPAPVQINMIGFPSTTGLTSIDYRVTDDRCDPPGMTDKFNTESLLRMPNIFWCYLPPHNAPDVGTLPADSGTVTFTSVNNFTKVTPDVQRLWARILAAVPNSKLILQTTAVASEHTQNVVRTTFAAQGVSSDRLEFRKPTSLVPYLSLLDRSDMTLDPFPFNGGTTTCHSLWMGAPVITLAGNRHASRMGLSMMTAIGLPEFVAKTHDEYVEIAVKACDDLSRLREIRAGMRDRLKASPLLDGAGYTRNLEAAYRKTWQTWCETPATA